MQAQPKHVDRRPQQRGRRSSEQTHDRIVRRNKRPMAVDRERRIRLVSLEHESDGTARGLQRRIGKGSLRKNRRVSRCDQQDVALTQGHVEPLGEMEDHLAGR